MSRQVGRIHHQHLGILAFAGQRGQDAGEDPHSAPADPAVIKRLVRTIGRRRVPPAQPIAIYKDNPAEHPPVINPRLAMRQRKERPDPRHLVFGQPIKIAHVTPPVVPSVNQTTTHRSSALMGSDPRENS